MTDQSSCSVTSLTMGNSKEYNVDEKSAYPDQSKLAGSTPRPRYPKYPYHTDTFVKYILVAAVGLMFGIALEKSRVHEPTMLRNQLILKKYIYLKLFLAIVATGMFVLSLLAMLPVSRLAFVRGCIGFFNQFSDRGISSSLLGGLLLGSGMAIAGSCPVLVFCQVGAAVPNACYTLGGCAVGVIVYGLFKDMFHSISHPKVPESSNPWVQSPYFVMALPIVAMFGVLVCALEILLPWDVEIKPRETDIDNFLESKAWPPYVCGILIGLLQLPMLLSMNRTLAISESLSGAMSLFALGPLAKFAPKMCGSRTRNSEKWQILFALAIIVGAYLSSQMSRTFSSVKGVPPSYAFTGGLLFMLGTEIAGGGTCEHGFTGWSFLSIISFLLMSTSFFFGVVTAFFLKFSGMWMLVK